MTAVLEAFAVIALVVGAGAFVGRIGVLGDSAGAVLNRVAFHVGVPALVFLNLAGSRPSDVLSPELMVSAVAALTVFGIHLATTSFRRTRNRATSTIGAWSASCVNAGNLGIPLSAYAFGGTTEVTAIMLFQNLLLIPLGVLVITSATSESLSVRGHVGAVAKNPIIAASMCGVILAVIRYQPPDLITETLSLLADLAIPTVLLAFGMSLSTSARPPREDDRVDVVLSVSLKCLAMPAVAYCVARWGFGASPHDLVVVTVLAALPGAQNINALAAVFEVGESLARKATLISTVVSIPLITAIVGLLS